MAERIPSSAPRQNTLTISASVPEAVKDRVKLYAKRHGLTEAEALRRIVAIGLQQVEADRG